MSQTTRKSFLLTMIPLVASTVSEAQTTPPQSTGTQTPPATNSGDISKLAEEQQAANAKIAKLQEDSKKISDRLPQIIEGVDSNIAKAQGDMKALAEGLNAKINALDEINKNRDKQQIVFYGSQYGTGFAVLGLMFGNVKKLKFAVTLATALKDFEGLLNPANNPVFIDTLVKIRPQINGNGNETLQTVLPKAIGDPVVGFLANPIVSTVLGIVSIFTSKPKSHDAPKVNEFTKVIDIIDAATKAQTQSKILSGKLAEINARIATFLKRAEDAYKPYMSAVGYSKTYAQYQDDIQAAGQDPMVGKIKEFFDPESKASPTTANAQDTRALITAKYQTEIIKTMLSEYDNIMKDMQNFITAFQLTLDYYDQEIPLTATTLHSVKDGLTALKNSSNKLLDVYNEAFILDVTPTSRRILYGVI